MDGDRGKNYPSKDDFSNDEHTLFLSASNITKEGFSFKSNQYINEERSNALGNGKLKHNDIILTSRGSVGHVAWYNSEVETKVPHARINSGMLILRSNNNIEASYITQYLKSPIGKRQIDLISFGSAQPQLTKKDVSIYKISLPERQEQLKLGKFFTDLDNTIALHQQKLDQLNKLKTIYLQAMLSTAEDNNPQMRFNNFNNEWKQRKLKDITEKGKSYSLSRNSETSNETGYKYIHYGDIHKKVAKIITHKSELPNIEMGNFELLEEGDLILADASEDYQGIAMPSLLAFTPKFKLIAGLHTIVLKPNKEIVDPLFLYYLIRSPKFRRYGYKIGTGMKVFGISATNLTNFESAFPLLKEQVKVSKFLLSLDDNITLQSLKIVQLKKVKKIYLQKMFV